MIGVGIDRVVMTVVVAMPMAAMRQRHAIGLAGPGAFVFAELAGLIEAFHMVVMAVLRRANFGFKAQHLLAVFAE